MKINLFSFSHAKCSGSIRKLVCCTDGVRKISPLQGDGNYSTSSYNIEHMVRKISPLQGDGNCKPHQVLDCVDLSRKEDKSPARGRKLLS